MSEAERSFVLVGGGLASASAAETLRADGFDGRITLVTEEDERPYERPPLSKKVLVGAEPSDVVYIHPESFYDEHDITLLTGDRVTGIDRDLGNLTTAAGRTLAFDRLLLATGASARPLPSTDRELAGVLTLRTRADAEGLHRALEDAGHVTIVGAGWIGCEVAAAARTLDVDVTMIDPLDFPLQRVLGAEVGAVFADLHRAHDVELRMGVGVSVARGNGRVEQVILSDGTTIETELVVVGIGVVPRTELAEGSGLEVDDGIAVDATLVTSDPRIHAAGDVASAWHPHYGRRLRVEHWANALNQGETAARNMLGGNAAYERLPYFFSDQYDLGLEYVGHATADDEVVVRGDVAAQEFIAFWLSDGVVAAALNVNVWDVGDDLKALIRARVPVDRARLADETVTLTDVLQRVG